MNGMDWWDALRWFNVAASCLVVILLTAGTIRRWDIMPPRFRRMAPWVIATYAVIAYGSGEVAAAPSHVPPGIRVALMSLTLIGLLVAALYGFDDETY